MVAINMRCITELITIAGVVGVALIVSSRSITTCVECKQVVQLQSPGFVRPRQLLQVLTGNIVVIRSQRCYSKISSTYVII